MHALRRMAATTHRASTALSAAAGTNTAWPYVELSYPADARIFSCI